VELRSSDPRTAEELMTGERLPLQEFPAKAKDGRFLGSVVEAALRLRLLGQR
jgi:hypothetical protein